MKAHWLYLLYVLRHKWYVFLWCCTYGIPFAGICSRPEQVSPALGFYANINGTDVNTLDMAEWLL